MFVQDCVPSAYSVYSVVSTWFQKRQIYVVRLCRNRSSATASTMTVPMMIS